MTTLHWIGLETVFGVNFISIERFFVISDLESYSCVVFLVSGTVEKEMLRGDYFIFQVSLAYSVFLS
jgi:hypothetical protein